MSQDCWLVVHGPLATPLASLASLYASMRMSHGGFVTNDDLEWNEINVSPVALHEVPGIEDIEAPQGSVAFNFSGHIPHPMHLPILDALAPRGGVFVFEDGDVEEVDSAGDPDALVDAARAAWAQDSARLTAALGRVPESDRYRLPLRAIAWLSRSFGDAERTRLKPILDLCDDIIEEDSPFAVDAEDEAALARMDGHADADAWAHANDASPGAARALVDRVARGEAGALNRLYGWATRYERPKRAADREGRRSLGEALLEAVESLDGASERRADLINVVHELYFWEGVDRLAAATAGIARYEALIEELREHAQELAESGEDGDGAEDSEDD